jgi:hypothetical protein
MLIESATANTSYTEKLARLREGWTDNSDLQSTYIYLNNIPHVVTVDPVKQYVSKFGTVIQCYPGESPASKPSVENTGSCDTSIYDLDFQQ